MRKTRAHDPVQGGLEARQDAGLTKREYFAAMAMQGLDSIEKSHQMMSIQDIADYAVKQADALIEALNEPKR